MSFKSTKCVSSNGVVVYTTYAKPCPPGTEPTGDIIYTGTNLPNTGVNNGDTLTVALQKIDNDLSGAELIAKIIAAISEDDDLRVALCTALNC